MIIIIIIIRMTLSNIPVLDLTQTAFHQENVTVYVILWFHQY